MKKKMKYIAIALTAIVVATSSCDKNFDKLNTDPNQTTSTTSSMLAAKLTGMILPGDQRSFNEAFLLAKYCVWDETNPEDIQYNAFGEVGFGAYIDAVNAMKMIEIANPILKDAYTGYGMWLKAYKLFDLTMMVGDIPYSEALKGADNVKPVYDSQKEVFRQIIADLDAAYEAFNKTSQTLEGDFSDVAGDPDKWKRIVNMTELRVLINLSKKVDDGSAADLNVATKFAEVAARPLMRDMNDSWKLSFPGDATKKAPWNVTQFYRTNMWFTDYLIDMMKGYGDRRLFYFAEPATKLIDEGKTRADWDAYVGVPAMISNPLDYTTVGNACGIHMRYQPESYAGEPYAGEPYARLSYIQQCFILAEGALRGWLPGKTASEFYNTGIRAAMEFTGDPAYLYGAEVGQTIDDAYITSYIASDVVKLTGNTDRDLKKILEQKFIAGWSQYAQGGDIYYDFRRTGYPALPNNPVTSKNELDRNAYPQRYRYPGGEHTSNLDNLTKAVESQFGGSDDVTQKMWVIK